MNIGFRAKRGMEPPLRLVLVRPGSTDFDQEGRIQGTLDVPLNARGLDEAAQVAAAIRDLPIRAIYTSPDLSSHQTSEILARALGGISTKVLPGLHNLDPGLWQGRLIDEVRNCQPKVYRLWQEDPEHVCPPEGEMIAEARNRMREAFDRISRKHETDAVVVVLREPVASIFKAVIGQRELGDLWAAQRTHDLWEILELELAPIKVKTR